MKYLVLLILTLGTLFGNELEFSNDYKAALAEAKKQDKLVYMLITSQNCRWCRKFEYTTLEDEGIMERLDAKYILLHIDRDKDYMPEKFKKKRVPRHYFVTSKGEVVYTFLGYWNVEDFGSFLEDVTLEYNKKFKGK